ncbi:hypothetical protein [Mesorhizobium sp. M1E.F.Ca.ET.041.01.1.1]|uniref:hypothetical protein n=1 Tax=Mesorhizobium sp. M1E.F.Ca.ET.041.01.1.1 TaxID=2496759 RepID=UPI000FCB64DB|nr:hypothetical protein [Mesorhizobium sp. M1E.F.Ca.ET.041.01.1.1]RUW24953.1 hypothetical protein EOA38_28510 [Mesorhizobium sp. M1E.F.Ca.ET.041.01.1.1]RWD92383.1 MAG: hypothetical protein EOS38_00690 [Mesorhizobium sp.]
MAGMVKSVYLVAPMLLLCGAVSAAEFSKSERAAMDRATHAIMRDRQNNELTDIKAFCADQWGDDYVMRKHCIGQQRASMLKATSFDTTASARNMRIFIHCGEQWADGKGRTDWFMMSHCIDEQVAAAESLGE